MNDDGTACGVGNVDDTMLRVTNAIRDAVRPDVTMFVECRKSSEVNASEFFQTLLSVCQKNRQLC